jgi:hypothetical protein
MFGKDIQLRKDEAGDEQRENRQDQAQDFHGRGSSVFC